MVRRWDERTLVDGIEDEGDDIWAGGFHMHS